MKHFSNARLDLDAKVSGLSQYRYSPTHIPPQALASLASAQPRGTCHCGWWLTAGSLLLARVGSVGGRDDSTYVIVGHQSANLFELNCLSPVQEHPFQ